MGKLFQNDAILGLKIYAEGVQDHIIKELIKSHRNFNLEICREFEELEKKAMYIPENTKDLLELGK